MLLGARLDALDVRRGIRRLLRPRRTAAQAGAAAFWYRWTKSVMRRAVPIGLAGSAVLLVLGLPFLGIKWGFPDDRVLPRSASAHQVGDRMRDGLRRRLRDRGDGRDPRRRRSDAGRLRALRRAAVAGGRRLGGQRAHRHLRRRPEGRPAGALPPGISRRQRLPDGRQQRAAVLRRRPRRSSTGCTRLPRPGGRAVEFTGMAQINRDSVDAITSRLPLVLAVIAVITFVLLFLLTGSVVLPLKALVLNVLSLTAAFGALVWIFQDGHLGAFGTTPTGTLVANMPVLLFCIAFGLSMDYEVFLISRIREFWLASGRTARRQRRERGTRAGPHRAGHHGRRAGHVDLVRRPDRRPGVVHADVRGGPDAGGPGRRHLGADGAGAGLHAHPRAVELVGTRTPGARCTTASVSANRALAAVKALVSGADEIFLLVNQTEAGTGYE